MTVTSTKITAGPYARNAVSGTFSYSFGIEDKTEIKVFETDADGVQTELTVDTDYTVNNVGVQTGGTVTRLAGALPVNYEWYLRSNYQQTQETAFESQGAFFPDIHERAFDKPVRLIQQLQDEINRAAKLPESYSGTSTANLPLPQAGYLMRWLGNEYGFENVFPSDLTGVVTLDSDLPKEYDNVAAAVVADLSLTLGKVVNTKGYHHSNDGGGAKYVVVAGGTGVADDVLFVNLDNGLQAKRLPINEWSFDLRQDAINAEYIGVGDTIYIRGITTVGDLGAGRYLCVPSGTGVDDNGSILNLASGNQIKLIPVKGVVFAEQFGVSGDESTDLANLQAAVNYTSSNDLTLTGGANTVALLSNRLVIKTNTRFKADGFTLKASASNPSTSGKVFGGTGISNFELSGLVFDGGLDISNVATTPLCQLYSCSDFTIKDCRFENSAGIGLNLSTNLSNGNILRNKLSNIGYTDGVGGVRARQGMAFSSGGHSKINIEYNEFENIGLDCISIGGINTGTIANNKHTNDNCYALIYNDALSYNLGIHDNFAKTAVNVVGSSRPQGLGIDLPKLIDSTVSGNICIGCASAGLAIFGGSTNVVVSSNVCSDNNKAGVIIHAAGLVVRGTVGPIILSNNLSSNRTGATQPTGFIVDKSQGSLINLDRTNKSYNCATEVASVTFSSSTDVGTVQFSYSIHLELTGNGTPEGVYSAPIGSLFTRLDGGAGTTFYYKESGTGNTGWVAK